LNCICRYMLVVKVRRMRKLRRKLTQRLRLRLKQTKMVRVIQKETVMRKEI